MTIINRNEPELHLLLGCWNWDKVMNPNRAVESVPLIVMKLPEHHPFKNNLSIKA